MKAEAVEALFIVAFVALVFFIIFYSEVTGYFFDIDTDNPALTLGGLLLGLIVGLYLLKAIISHFMWEYG